jgi:hypothetical protein
MNSESQAFFHEVGKLGGTGRKAPSLFALGGRGYYENPTSDLLAFFMRPDGVHGLGDLFLVPFLECMPPPGSPPLDLSRVSVNREVPTSGGRIDLLVLGPDWCLVIENKIRHGQVNPFTDYERYARDLRPRSFFAVLSPEGRCAQPGWVGVSYRSYLAALRGRVSRRIEKSAPGKWLVFAEELILHLESELDLTPMTPEQVALVEKNAPQIAKAAQLAADYRVHVRRILKDKLDETLRDHAIGVVDEGWAYRCTSARWRENDMVLIYDAATGLYSVRTYLDGKDHALIAAAKSRFSKLGYVHDKEGQWHHWTLPADSVCQQAVEMAAQLAATVSDLIVDKS